MLRKENREIVTLTNIAQVIGVSQPVVSKVLNGGGGNVRVSQKTAARIEKVAKEMGYRANLAAKAMRSGKFGAAGLLLSMARYMSILPEQLLNGIMKGLADHSLHLTIAQLPDEKLVSKGFIPKILRECLVDGLLINYNTAIPQAMIELIGTQRIPAIWINSKQSFDSIYFDDIHGAHIATDHLLKLGHRRIAFSNLTGLAHYSAEDRWKGYQIEMVKAGLKPQAIICDDRPRSEQLMVAVEALRAENRPTAILAYGFATASVWTKAASVVGIKIPDDLSLSVFSDKIEYDVDMTLTTCLLPEFDMGITAVEMMIERIKISSKALKPRKLDLQLIPGESTSPPRALSSS